MRRNDEILSFVDSNLKLEGMTLSSAEKQTIKDCLSGKTTFDDAIAKAFARHKRATA